MKTKNKKINKDKWIWMPHAGHLCVANYCRFHLNTYVGKYIVSTIGEYWPVEECRRIHAKIFDQKWYLENCDEKGNNFDFAYMKRFGFEEIGFNRKYETMVFNALKDKKNKCCPYSARDWSNIDMDGYNSAEDAYKGHLRLCKKWSQK